MKTENLPRYISITHITELLKGSSVQRERDFKICYSLNISGITSQINTGQHFPSVLILN